MATPTFSSLDPSQTATLVGTYVPPFATGTTFVASHATTGTGTLAGGFNPIPATSSYPSNPTAPAFQDDVSWVTGYLLIHSLPSTSYVYAYFLWFAVLAVFVLMALLRLTGMRGGVLGAMWQKWALRRRTWRKKHALREAAKAARKRGESASSAHRQPKALPSNAQLLTFGLIVIAVIILCVAGPDYIDPDARLFTFPSTPSSSSSSSSKSKRASTNGSTSVASIVSFFTAHYTIPKALWSSAARTGNIAFALLPLTVLLALKAPPFAIFAIPWFVNLHFDKLVRMHRWAGRMVWVATTAHVVMWSIQLARDTRAGTDQSAWHFAFEYVKFRFGWASYGLLTLLVFTSLESLRSRRFAIFYGLHIILTPAMLITAALHHPPVWYWCWAALGLWAGERLWRFTWFLYTNGIVGGIVPKGVNAGNMDSVGNEKTTVSRIVPTRATNSVATTATFVGSDRGIEKGRPNSFAPSEAWEMGEMKSPISARSPAPLMQGQDQTSAFPPSSFVKRPRTPDSDVSSDYRTSYFDGNFGTNSRRGSFAPATPGTPGFGALGTGASTPVAGLGLGAGGYTPGTPGEITRAQTPLSFSSRAPLNPAANAPSPSATPRPGRGAVGGTSYQGPLPSQYVPPPGYAHATLLPGRTVRLRLVTPGYLTWAPGQHFLLCIPSISRLATHPFSVASVCDEQAAVRFEKGSEQGAGGNVLATEAGREMVLLVRAKKGWTKRLWDLVYRLQEQGESVPTGESLPDGFAPPPRGPSAPHAGIVLRTLVDGPFGSSGRVNWGAYSSVLIVAGGSGVSFGTSILEYVCLCLAGRDGRYLGGHAGRFGAPGWKTHRVRFVWLVREYAHIQWVATALRRCLEILPPDASDALEMNIWVTNYQPPKELKPPAMPALPRTNSVADSDVDSELAPPVPQFARKARPLSVGSEDSVDSDVSVDSITDLYFGSDEESKKWTSGGEGGARGADESSLGHETHVLDYTNFDGDNDDPLPGENQLSRTLKKEGKLRRAKTRKTEKALAAKLELEDRVAHAHAHTARPPSDSGLGQGSFETSHGHGQNRMSTVSSAPLLAGSPPQSPSSPSLHSPFADQSLSSRLGGSTPYLDPSTPGDAPKRRSARPLSVASSSYTTATFDAQSSRWQEPFGASADATGLTIDPQEIQDLRFVSEVARPGKPKLARILADEVERSKGRVVVACCGPTSLNALMRKVVAAKIDPKRIMRGDERGYIDFMCEDFDY